MRNDSMTTRWDFQSCNPGIGCWSEIGLSVVDQGNSACIWNSKYLLKLSRKGTYQSIRWTQKDSQARQEYYTVISYYHGTSLLQKLRSLCPSQFERRECMYIQDMREITNLTLMRVTMEKRRRIYLAFCPAIWTHCPFHHQRQDSQCTEDEAMLESMGEGEGLGHDKTSSSTSNPE